MKRYLIVPALLVLFFSRLGFSSTLTVPGQYPSIQSAINGANDGDVIIVSRGTYMENINFLGKAITVKSIDPNNSEVVASTIIDGGQKGSVVAFRTAEGSEAVLNGVTLQNGKDAYGGGIYCLSASPTIVHCTVQNNIAELATWWGMAYGGGIYCSNASPQILNCIIKDNSALGDGGGIYCTDNSSPFINGDDISDNKATCGGGIYAISSTPFISYSRFSGNTGSGIYFTGSSGTITECDLISNTGYMGGGIYCTSSSSPSITYCLLSGNTASFGGGIFCDHSSPSISNSIICSNKATAWLGGGGGIEFYYSSSVVSECFISGNTADEEGGCGGGIDGFYFTGQVNNCQVENNKASKGGGINFNTCAPVIIECAIKGNRADSGGGIRSQFGEGGRIERTIFTENFAISGGAADFSNTSSSFMNCLIFENAATNAGGGLALSSKDSSSILCCTISGNSAPKGGGIYSNNSSPMVVNTILWGDTSQEITKSYGTVAVSYSDIQGAKAYTGEGNINTDPLFVDSLAGDYHLQSGSPCINSGIDQSAPLIDMDGNLRPMNEKYDIGAYEYAVSTLVTLEQFSAVFQDGQVVITWATLSEISTAGFNLWRSESANGRYIKINSHVIPAEGGAVDEAEYTWIDNIIPGYYYRLEEISCYGDRSYYGPITSRR